MFESKKKKMGPLGAGVLGAVVGAAGSAAAITLANKENRKKIGKRIHTLKKQASQTAEDLKEKIQNVNEEGKEKMKGAKKEAQKRL